MFTQSLYLLYRVEHGQTPAGRRAADIASGELAAAVTASGSRMGRRVRYLRGLFEVAARRARAVSASKRLQQPPSQALAE